MVRNDEGLTKTYNRFHDPDERDPDILKLRELHDAMDRAVLDAYGWTDIQPTCEFLLDYEDEDEDDDGGKHASRRKKPWRYRWPDDVRDEVLARLLALNAEARTGGSARRRWVGHGSAHAWRPQAIQGPRSQGVRQRRLARLDRTARVHMGRTSMAPPTRSERFVQKAETALLAAIEIYNKPAFPYREETFAILAINAWELLLKARLLHLNSNDPKCLHVYETRTNKKGRQLKKKYLKRNRAGQCHTLGLGAALVALEKAKSAPTAAVRRNLDALTEIRDGAVHYIVAGPMLAKQAFEVGTATCRELHCPGT